ncbi:MAG: hypothetical protein RJA81_160 [Planctomycetota bacterium]
MVANLLSSGCAREKAVYRPTRETSFESHIKNADTIGPNLSTAYPQPSLNLAVSTFQEAKRLEDADRNSAVWKYRSAALISEAALALGDNSSELSQVHRLSIHRILQLTGADHASSTEELADKLAQAGLTIRLADPDWQGLSFTKFVPCEDFEDRNIEPIVERNGWGLPILADRIYQKDEIRAPAESFFAPDNRLTCTARISSSLVGQVSGVDWSQIPADLILHSPFDDEQIVIGSTQTVTLAADFTTPSLVQFSQSGLQALEYEGLLLPGIAQEKATIYLNEPYRPGKIPVLFVHGLWSSPRTWTDMNNGLLADPDIRRNYQFLFALYPSGEPVMESARILREKIREVRDTFDPGHQDPAWDHMVVVCHSMGGIISRLLMTNSEQYFVDAVFTQPLESLNISHETYEMLRGRLQFQAVPEIRRTVFIAPVFRGSSFASRPLGRLSSMLIRPLDDLGDLRNELISNHPAEILQPEFRRLRIANGIDNLEPDNPFLLAMDKTMPAPGKDYHIILGNNGRFLPRMRGIITDGLVTYQSGHLDGAQSETIYQANHYLNHNQPVINEVNQILRMHLGLGTQAKMALSPDSLETVR